MGISYSACLVVGVQRGMIENYDKLEQLIDDYKIEVFAPSYDGGSDDDAVVGLPYIITESYSSSPVAWDMAKIDSLKAEFLELVGQEAQIWLTPNGS